MSAESGAPGACAIPARIDRNCPLEVSSRNGDQVLSPFAGPVVARDESVTVGMLVVAPASEARGRRRAPVTCSEHPRRAVTETRYLPEHAPTVDVASPARLLSSSPVRCDGSCVTFVPPVEGALAVGDDGALMDEKVGRAVMGVSSGASLLVFRRTRQACHWRGPFFMAVRRESAATRTGRVAVGEIVCGSASHGETCSRVLLAFHLPRPAHESVPQEGGTPAEAGTGDEPNGRLAANSQVVSGVLIKEIHKTETPRRRETPPQPTAVEREVMICSRSRPIPTRPERPGSRAALVPHLLARPLRRALHAWRRPRPSLPDPRPARGFQRRACSTSAP